MDLSVGSQPLKLHKEMTCNAGKVKQYLKLFYTISISLTFLKEIPWSSFFFFTKACKKPFRTSEMMMFYM